MRPWLILLSGLIAATAHASGDDDLYENQCHDQAAWAKIDDLLKKAPNDPLVIRSYALRIGICRLIDENKVSLQQGIEIFDLEKQRTLMERMQQDAAKTRAKPIPAEDLEPQG